MSNTKTGLLGDTPARNYANKLELFNRFAEPELKSVINDLELGPGDRVLDAGCGVGLMSLWFAEQVAPNGETTGIDLSTAHIEEARSHAAGTSLPVQFIAGDMLAAPFETGSFDLIFTGNAIHHARDPIEALREMSYLLRPGGRVVAGQSAMLPDMFFAWDQRLEWQVTQAVRRYYRDKYSLSERELTDIRRTYGMFRDAGLADVSTRTIAIDRASPLGEIDRQYFQRCVFEGYWGNKLRPYLTDDDWNELERLCDPDSSEYALDRPDFHHIQTYTVISGRSNV